MKEINTNEDCAQFNRTNLGPSSQTNDNKLDGYINNTKSEMSKMTLRNPLLVKYNLRAFLITVNVVQIAVGSGMFIFSFGSGIVVGSAIMREGIFNIINVTTNVKVFILKSWLQQKIIMLFFIFLFSGIDSIADAYKTVFGYFQDNHFVFEHRITQKGWIIAMELIVLVAIECIIAELIVIFAKQRYEKLIFRNILKCFQVLTRNFNKFNIMPNRNDKLFQNQKQKTCRNMNMNKTIYTNNTLSFCLAIITERKIIADVKFNHNLTLWYIVVSSLLCYKLAKIMFSLKKETKKYVCDKPSQLYSYKHNKTDKVKNLSEVISYKISDIAIEIIFMIILSMSVHNLISNLNYKQYNNLKVTIKSYKAERRILLCQSYNFEKIAHYLRYDFEDYSNIQQAKLLIDDLSSGGQAGIPHLGALSVLINRPIQVFNRNGDVNLTVGVNNFNTPVYIQHHGYHWNVLGGIEPTASGINNCLFDAVAHQTGISAWNLRQSTSKYMTKHINIIATQIDDIKFLKKHRLKSLLIGGARYIGRSAADASRIIDASQGVSGHAHYPKGHPRGHASHPGVSDPEGSVENYSQRSSSLGDAKSGFESRNAQDVVAHATLSTQDAQDAMSRLNEGSTREALTIPAYELNGVDNIKMAKWVQGRKETDWSSFRSVTVVLQHHKGSQNNPSADVHVHTFYPRD